MALRNIVFIGGVLLIALGIWHGVHVGRADDVEPYLWLGSLFLIVQGVLTVTWVRRTGD